MATDCTMSRFEAFCRRCCGVVATLSCVGCTVVGPTYRQPSIDAPSAWSPAAVAAMEAASLPSRAEWSRPAPSRWWSVFDDPVLDALVADALAQNLDLQTATLRIAEARASRDATAAAALPSVGLTGVGGRERMSENGIAGALTQGGGGGGNGGGNGGGGLASNLFQAGFDATWELDLWGKVRRGVEAADAQVRSASAQKDDALVSLSAEIARSYFALRGFQRELAIVDEDIATQAGIARLTDSRTRAGFTPQGDSASQFGQLASAESQRPQLAQSAAQAANALGLLLSMPPGALAERLAPQPDRSLKPLPTVVDVGLPGDLLQRRPDVRGREADLRAAVARVGVAKADVYPTVRLGLFGGLQATRAADLRSWASRFLAGGSAISLPLFEGGQLKAQIRLADLRSQEAALGFRTAVLAAYRDADDAVLAYANEQQRTGALAQRLAQATRNRVYADHRHDAGLAPLTEPMDAHRGELAARLTLSQSETASRTNLVALYKALGGGWDDAGSSNAR